MSTNQLLIGGGFAAAVAVAAVTFLGERGLPWEGYVSHTGSYEVELPGTPKLQNMTENAGGLRIEVELAAVELEHGAFLASFADYPPDFADVDPTLLLEGVRDGMLQGPSRNLTLEESRPIELAGYPGLALKASGSVGLPVEATLQARVYLVDTRLYQVLFTGAAGKTSQTEIDRFLESFELR